MIHSLYIDTNGKISKSPSKLHSFPPLPVLPSDAPDCLSTRNGLTPGLQLESHKTARQEARRSGSFNLLFMPPSTRSSALIAGVFHRVHLVVENVINEV